jgi:hypothetical protein
VSKPLAIDLYAGLGGWAEGFLAEGYRVVGFDIERHQYPRRVLPGELSEGWDEYPGQLVLQDVLTLHGAQFRDAACIVASPPCQRYSYMAMPFSRGRKLAQEYRDGVRSVEELNALFEACFRIQREASAAAGRWVPLVVENVKGAQPWVGRAVTHYGSYYLWGDVPALMPAAAARKSQHHPLTETPDGVGVTSWFHGNSKREARYYGTKTAGQSAAADGMKGKGSWVGDYQEMKARTEGLKFGGGWWHDSTNNLIRKVSSKSPARRAASAQIAKIPLPLAQWVAKVYHPG